MSESKEKLAKEALTKKEALAAAVAKKVQEEKKEMEARKQAKEKKRGEEREARKKEIEEKKAAELKAKEQKIAKVAKMGAKKEQEVQKIFFKHDTDKSGTIDPSELMNALKALKMETSDADLKELMKDIDLDGNGKLSLQEFKLLFCEARLGKLFNKIDADGSGHIQTEELYFMMRSLGYEISVAEVRSMVRKIDKNKDGQISFEEFKAYFDMAPVVSLAGIAKFWLMDTHIDVGSDLAPPIPASPHVPWYYGAFAGIGGIVSRTATAPLERVKIIAQTANGKVSMTAELRHCFKTSGLRGLFAGNLANCLRVFPQASIVTYAYLNCLAFTPANDNLDPMEPIYRGIAASLAGVCGQVLTYPIDVVRAKLTVAKAGANKVGIVQCTREIFRTDGMKGLFRGLVPTLLTVGPFIGCQFCTADIMKMALADRGVDVTSTSVLLGITGTAGMVAQTVVYPLDVLRRRMQLSSPSAAQANETVLADKTWSAMQQVVKQHGIRSLFAGIVPTYIKVFPSVALAMTTTKVLIAQSKELDPSGLFGIKYI